MGGTLGIRVIWVPAGFAAPCEPLGASVSLFLGCFSAQHCRALLQLLSLRCSTCVYVFNRYVYMLCINISLYVYIHG